MFDFQVHYGHSKGNTPDGEIPKAVKRTLKTEYHSLGQNNETSVTRGPVIKKTGWPRGQWSGANPTPECFPFSGVPGANYPKTEEGWEELGKRVATAHANYVIEKIERLNCPTWQKLELYQAVIDTTKGTYKPKEHQKPGWQPGR